MLDPKKLAIFLSLLVLVMALDLVTKYWAADSLATIVHVLPLKGPDGGGVTAKEFLAQSGFESADARALMKLAPALETDKAAQYPTKRITADMGYYVFLDESRADSPLYLANPALKDFSKRKETGQSEQEWRAAWTAKELPWVELLTKEFPFLNEEEAGEILDKKLVHPLPVPSQRTRLTDLSPIVAGEVYLLTRRDIELIPGYLGFIYAENPGAAWGLFRDSSLFVRVFFLQIVSLFAMGLIIYVALKTPKGHLLSVAALAGILGGAAGNFVGRFSRYVVVDFVDMHLGDSHWPTYNVADIGITVGVAILVIQVLRKKSPF